MQGHDSPVHLFFSLAASLNFLFRPVPPQPPSRKELRLLDQLYTLYQQVISTVDEYKAIPWSEVMANIQQMNETVEAFNQRCRHLPRGLKSWEAFLELSQTIEDFIEIVRVQNIGLDPRSLARSPCTL